MGVCSGGWGPSVSLLGVAQRTMAAVQEAALAKAHEGRQAWAPRRKRRKWERRLFARLIRAKTKKWQAEPVPPPAAEEACQAGVHDLRAAPEPGEDPAAEPGPAPPPAPSRARPLTCANCRTTVKSPAAARRLLLTPCVASPVAAQTLTQCGPHDLARVPNGWGCRRCGLNVRPGHRAGASKRRCPVPTVHTTDGQECTSVLGMLRTFFLSAKRLAAQAEPTRPAAPDEAAPAPADPLTRLRWTSHLAVSDGTLKACLRCGSTADARDPRRLEVRA